MPADWIDLSIDLATLRDRPASAATRALELEQGILRVERAQREVRNAVTKSDEDLARFHLDMAAGHLAKVTKLHKGVPTWKPKKQKKQPLKPPLHSNQQLSPAMSKTPDATAGRAAAARRLQYRGRSELRFRGIGAEQRTHGAHRRSLEVRNIAGGTGSLVQVEGRPILYGTPYTVADRFGEFTETMQAGVAAHLIDTADCRFLFGHGGMPLARTTAGTMKLHDTPDALTFSATVDTRQRIAQDLIIAIERGDVSQMSVGFVVETDDWSEDYTKRSISRFRSLEDVSAVTSAASPSTSISLAGMGGRV